MESADYLRRRKPSRLNPPKAASTSVDGSGTEVIAAHYFPPTTKVANMTPRNQTTLPNMANEFTNFAPPEVMADPQKNNVRLAFSVNETAEMLEPVVRQGVEPGAFAEAAGADKVERALEFCGQHGGVEPGFARRFAAVHFAIDAVEVATLVGIHVHADGEAVRAG